MKKTERKKRMQRGKYVISLIGLAMVFVAAFWLPQAVFAMQDYYQVNRAVQEDRGTWEFASFDTDYESDVGVRMEEFAAGVAAGRQYYVLASEYEPDAEEMQTILETFFESEWMSYTDYLTMDLVHGYDKYKYEFQDCKRYVIFEENFESGIALSCLYLELSSPYYESLKIIMDLKDNTIYYVKAEVDRNILPEFLGIMTDGYKYEMFTDFTLFYGGRTFPYWLSYYYGQFYQADSVVGWTPNEYIYGHMDAQDLEHICDISANVVTLSTPIFFGENALMMDLLLSNDAADGMIKASVGIHEIGELIPELVEG